MQVPVIIPYAFLVSAFRARQDHPIQDSQSWRAAAMPTASTQEVCNSCHAHKLQRIMSLY